MAILLFFIILSAVVLVHECGHFFVAKKSGIEVREFGFGFPPRLFAKKMGETTYSVNALPFGGFVKIAGESEDEAASATPPHRKLTNKSRLVQAAVTGAGVMANIIFAWLLISLGLAFGLPTSVTNAPVNASVENSHILITEIKNGSPAEQGGLKPGDTLVYLSTSKKTLTDEKLTVSAVQDFIASSAGQEIFVGYRRGEEPTRTTTVEPAGGILDGKPAIGIGLDEIGILRLPPVTAFVEGARMTASLTRETAKSLGALAASAFRGHFALSSVTGPVGIIGLVNTAAHFGVAYLATFTALLSINLALINLIPFPALDGGRLFVLLIESVKRSPLNPKVINNLNIVGFVFLIGLMLIVTGNDILRLFLK
jgi:regulator of sigma E protease